MEKRQNQTEPLSKGSLLATVSLVKSMFCSHKATPKRKVGAQAPTPGKSPFSPSSDSLALRATSVALRPTSPERCIHWWQ